MQKRIYSRNGLSSERAIEYLQTTYKTAQYQQLAVEEHLRTCGDRKFRMFPFFKIIQENKSLRKFYEDYFIDKLKPLHNKKTSVAKPPKIADS